MRTATRFLRLIDSTGAVVPFLLLRDCGRLNVEPVRPAPMSSPLAGEDLGVIAFHFQVLIASRITKARIPGLQMALIRDGRSA